MTEDFSKYNGEGTILRKTQIRMLEILIAVDAICKKHNISYILDGGTCLGAVRHGGFIPWDDDLDIAVMRKDFLKLRKILPKELPDNLYYQDETTDPNYWLKIAKVRDKNSVFYMQEDVVKTDAKKGIFIDIIPMENILSFKSKNIIDYFYGRSFKGIKHYFKYGKKEIIISHLLWIPMTCIVFVYRFFTWIFAPSKICHAFGWPSYNFVREKDIFPTKDIEFEGKTVQGPANPHNFLTALFGNYMQIPSEKMREVHSINIIFLNE